MKTQFKKLMFLPLLMAIILSGCMIDVNDSNDDVNNTNFSASESFLHEIPVESKNHLTIDGINSQIDINGKDNLSQVTIWGEKIVESESQEDAEIHLQNLQVNITSSLNRIYIETEQPNNTHGRNYLVKYHVDIPKTWQVNIDNVNGIIELDSIKSDISIDQVNGEIQIQDVESDLIINLTNGQVNSQMILPQNGKCEITGVNAQIVLTIPKTTSATFESRVTNGTVALSNLNLQNMESTQSAITGILGDGDGKIKLIAVNGTISTVGY